MNKTSPQDFYGNPRILHPITHLLILSSNNKKDRAKYDNEAIIVEILKYDEK